MDATCLEGRVLECSSRRVGCEGALAPQPSLPAPSRRAAWPLPQAPGCKGSVLTVVIAHANSS